MRYPYSRYEAPHWASWSFVHVTRYPYATYLYVMELHMNFWEIRVPDIRMYMELYVCHEISIRQISVCHGASYIQWDIHMTYMNLHIKLHGASYMSGDIHMPDVRKSIISTWSVTDWHVLESFRVHSTRKSLYRLVNLYNPLASKVSMIR